MTQATLTRANDLHALLDDLVDRVPAADQAVLLSPDGLPVVTSREVDAETANYIAAAAAALHSLAVAAGLQLRGGAALRTIVEMEHVLLTIAPAGDHALLVVTFRGAPDPEAVNGVVAATADRAGRALATIGPVPLAVSGSMP